MKPSFSPLLLLFPNLAACAYDVALENWKFNCGCCCRLVVDFGESSDIGWFWRDTVFWLGVGVSGILWLRQASILVKPASILASIFASSLASRLISLVVGFVVVVLVFSLLIVMVHSVPCNAFVAHSIAFST